MHISHNLESKKNIYASTCTNVYDPCSTFVKHAYKKCTGVSEKDMIDIILLTWTIALGLWSYLIF